MYTIQYNYPDLMELSRNRKLSVMYSEDAMHLRIDKVEIT
jgi:hypothetical protein